MPGRMVLSQEPQESHNELGEDGGQILRQALGDEAGLNEEMIGLDFALDGVAVVEGFAVKVLVTVAPA